MNAVMEFMIQVPLNGAIGCLCTLTMEVAGEIKISPGVEEARVEEGVQEKEEVIQETQKIRRLTWTWRSFNPYGPEKVDWSGWDPGYYI